MRRAVRSAQGTGAGGRGAGAARRGLPGPGTRDRAPNPGSGGPAGRGGRIRELELGAWAGGYFFLRGPDGISVRPDGGGGGGGGLGEADLRRVEAVARREAGARSGPLLLTFPQIAVARARELGGCFASAMGRYGFGGQHRAVFPLKASHDRATLLSLLNAAGGGEGSEGSVSGLEVGSKAELAAAVALLGEARGAGHPRRLLVCNGTKDYAYLDLASAVAECGLADVFVVLEDLDEVELAVSRLKAAAGGPSGRRPRLGLRAKLDTAHDGHFGRTSGPRSQFGMGPAELWESLQLLRCSEANLLSSLNMLHFHVGTQVPDIRIVKEALREACVLYAEFCRSGAPMGWLDVGGGLGVDFGGAEVNYSTQNYCNDVVAAVQDICRRRDIAPPVIITECGTAIVAHSAVLISRAHPHSAAPYSRVLGGGRAGGNGGTPAASGFAEAEYLIGTFEEVLKGVSPGRLRESLTDALQLRSEASSLFALGAMTLEQRAAADLLVRQIIESVRAMESAGGQGSGALALEVADILRAEAPYLTLELSVFQSLIDAWGLGQSFPVVPLQRLGEEPDRWARLADVTCDSDGRLQCSPAGPHDRASQEASGAMRVHHVSREEDYRVAVFMVGAYQRCMASAHNLFGAPASASVVVDEKGQPSVLDWGSTARVEELLRGLGHGAYSEGLQMLVEREPAVELALQAVLASSTYPTLGEGARGGRGLQ